VARRAATAASRVSREVLSQAGSPARGETGPHGTGPGARPQWPVLGRKARARRVVRRPSEPRARPEDTRPYGGHRPSGPRCERPRARYHARVPRHSCGRSAMTSRYLVIGAAGHAEEVAWSLREQRRAEGVQCEFIFFDDRRPPGRMASGLGYLAGPLETVGEHVQPPDTSLVLGVGLPRTKLAVTRRLAPLGLRWATVIHPAATIGPNVSIGEGSYVGAGAIVTVNVRIGRFATVNMHCQVAHDDVLGDFVTLHPDAHLAGNVSIGDGA